MCTNICSWNVTEIQLVHQQLAKCYYLNSGRKGARGPKAAVFNFILSKPCDWEVTLSSTGYFLSSICTLWRITHFSISIHFHPFPLFFKKWTWKQYHHAFQMFHSREKRKYPGEVYRSAVMVPGSQPGFLPSMTMQVLPRLFTYFFSLKNTQYQHCPALVSEVFKH